MTVVGRGAIADALLNLFLALAMFDIIRYQADPHALLRRRVFLWIGLGLLVKGPVALLVPAGASALAYGLQGRLREWWRAACDPLGWLILLAVAAPWYLLEYARQGDAFLIRFLHAPQPGALRGPLQGHGGSLLYYVPAVLLVLLPYSGLFLATFPGLRRLRSAPADTFLWSWFLFVFGFFSLAGTKLPHYMLYGVTPLFVLMARRRRACAPAGWPSARRCSSWRPCWRCRPRSPAPRPASASLAARGAGPARHLRWRLAGRRRAAVRAGAGPGAVARGAGLAAAGGGDSRAPCATAVLLLPALAALQQAPVKEAALLARREGWQVSSWRINVPSFSVYRQAVTPPTLAPRPGEVILTRSDALAGLGAVQVLYRKGGVVLVRMPG